MPAPSSDERGGGAAAGDAPFILVAVGTSLDPFDRLLQLVDDLCHSGALPLPVFAQIGHTSYRPRAYHGVPFLPAETLEARIRDAAAVICHGGAGLIGSCLQARKRPVVFPRRAAHGEIVNDHQLELCAEMQAQGRIYLAQDRESLLAGIAAALRPAQGPDAGSPPGPGGDRLRARVAAVLAEIARGRGRDRQPRPPAPRDRPERSRR